jgi:hypothetical protein
VIEAVYLPQADIGGVAVSALEQKGVSLTLDTKWADLVIPAGAVSGQGDVTVKVEPVAAPALPSGVSLAGDVVNVEVKRGGSAVGLAKRVTLVLAYNQSLAADQDTVFAYRLNEDGSLTCLGGTVAAGKVTVDLSHLSKYAALVYQSGFGDIAGHWAKRDPPLWKHGASSKGYRPRASLLSVR